MASGPVLFALKNKNENNLLEEKRERVWAGGNKSTSVAVRKG